MKKWFGLAMGVALVALLAGTAFAQGWGQEMGPGMMGYPCQGGMGWGQMGPGMMGSTGAAQITEERAKELAQQYTNSYLKGYTLDKLLPITNGMGMTMYAAELKGTQGEVRTLHVNPWGGVMPYGGPWRRGG